MLKPKFQSFNPRFRISIADSQTLNLYTVVQDLMERVSEWSPVTLTARIPVIGVHLPSRRPSGGFSLDEGYSGDPQLVSGISVGGTQSINANANLVRDDSAMWDEEAVRHADS